MGLRSGFGGRVRDHRVGGPPVNAQVAARERGGINIYTISSILLHIYIVYSYI